MRWRCHRKGRAGLYYRLAVLLTNTGQSLMVKSNILQLKVWEKRRERRNKL